MLHAAVVDPSLVFIELGMVIAGLAILSRLANRIGISAIPLYLLGGLAFGNGGLIPLRFSEEVVHVGAETGVLLLLFMLGLEYSIEELGATIRASIPAGAIDLALNFSPGFLGGLIAGWGFTTALLLGGVTYISSSGIVARLLEERNWGENPETPTVLGVLVMEDLAMAVFLPLIAVLLIGQGMGRAVASIAVALATVGAIFLLAFRYGRAFSRGLAKQPDEVVLLTTVGLVLLVAGLAQRLQVSSAVGAFLVGIALSGPVTSRVHRLVGPLRDLSAACFFLFFGLQIDPGALGSELLPALGLALLTTATKILTGWWAARRGGVGARGRWRAGVLLVPRGEFSIVIAGLGVGAAGVDHRLGPLAAAYVLMLAILGTVLARLIDPILARFLAPDAEPEPAVPSAQ